MRSVPAGLLIGLIRTYQHLRAPAQSHCRFFPTCSEYAREALEGHGALRGCGLTLRRLARCHPFGGHGYDPVPEVTAGRPTPRGIHWNR